MNLLDLIFGKKTENTKALYSLVKHKVKVFIVDDNAAFARLTENHLMNKEKFGAFEFEIHKFENGELCIQNLDANPDLILLDYYLGDGTIKEHNGDEIFKRIVSINKNQKVVMLSGLEESSIVKSLINLGLIDFIIKDEEMFDNLKKVICTIFDV